MQGYPSPMQIYRNSPPIAAQRPRVLTIGNFDGVHLGHQTVIQELRKLGAAHALPVSVLTFDPHPKEYFARSRGAPTLHTTVPGRIQSLRDKACALQATGVEDLIVAHFNQRLSQMPATDFVEQFLVNQLQVKHLFVGDDFRFGAKRTGDFDLLKNSGSKFGFTVDRMPTVERLGQRVSSSRVRDALLASNFAEVRELLGRPFTMSGNVIHGRKLGRTLGFPTLNMIVPGATLASSSRPLLQGIFAVRIRHLSNNLVLNGVASLGTRPAVEQNGRYLLETHVFNYQGNAYGKTISIEFVKKLRDEAHYDGLEALTKQIAIDAEQAKLVLSAIDIA